MMIGHDAASLPKAGPYSHAIEHDHLLHLSGQTPFDPETGQLVVGDVRNQTAQCFRNLGVVLGEAGLSLRDVVKCNVYLVDMADFAEMNAEYAMHVSAPQPARTTVAVVGLPLGARVEIELVARRPRL